MNNQSKGVGEQVAGRSEQIDAFKKLKVWGKAHELMSMANEIGAMLHAFIAQF